MPEQQESARARSARHYLIDGPSAARLHSTLALVAQSLGFPVVRVSILDQDTQHTIGLFGVGDATAIPRAQAFCDAVVRTGRPLRVEDASVDPLFSQFPSVAANEIGAYIGVPFTGRESFIVEAVCVIDPHQRTIDDDLQARLTEFARIVEDQLDLIRRLKEQRREGDVATNFDHPECVTRLHEATADAGVSPGSEYLELTETMQLTPGRTHIAGVVQRLRGIGFRVWLDDFGTGWASLDHLLWLRVDGVKIDRAVTVALGTPIGDALTQAVTGLANALGLNTTIEGIETRCSAERARVRGCGYGQGYLWAPPVPATVIDDFRARQLLGWDGSSLHDPAQIVSAASSIVSMAQ
jgi:EAL domain-containing protein (putative c-di-GMP-specific phosphodiesterase class I)